MQVRSIAECSIGSIPQYFWPSLSYNLSLRPLFCLFLSGLFTQILLYFLGAQKNLLLRGKNYNLPKLDTCNCLFQFVILVIDSTDRERLSITKEELYKMLATEVRNQVMLWLPNILPWNFTKELQ